MRHSLLLPLLLGTVAALHLDNHAPYLDSQDEQADLSQDPEGSGDQEGEWALTEEEIQSEKEQVETSGYQNDCEDEKAMELDPSALDNNFQCPRTEDTVQILGSPGCETCKYLLVRTPKCFRNAQNTCRRCYRGDLASIHSSSSNYRIQSLTVGLNQGQVWIGGISRGCVLLKKYHWIDGSRWDYRNWASGQPKFGIGSCVTLGTRGGHWRRAICSRHLPFICST